LQACPETVSANNFQCATTTIDKRRMQVGLVPIVEQLKRRSRQNLGTKTLRAQVIDLLARKISAQQFKDCHGAPETLH
jgi:hypothetical protein